MEPIAQGYFAGDGALFLTGATGAVGLEVLRLLIDRRPKSEVRLLIRGQADEVRGERWPRLLALASGGKLKPEDLPGFVPIAGDIAMPHMGLDAKELDELRCEVTDVLHGAANIGLMEKLDRVRVANVEGTRYVLEFAQSCKSLRRVGHMSTTFVSGRRSGVINEGDLDHDSGFISPYEKSKYEAEHLVRARMKDLPIAVYRLTLLLGRTDGYVHDFGSIHHFLNAFYNGLCPIIPGLPTTRFDFLPTDHAAKSLLELFERHFTPGATYHISAADAAIPVGEWIDLNAKIFSESSRPWKNGQFVPPEVVTAPTYRLFVDSVETIKNPRLRRVAKMLATCADHLLLPKYFCRAKTDAMLPPEFAPPPVASYYPNIVRYLIATNWGRLREATP
jgi:long-chain acyl-CoA synthetase